MITVGIDPIPPMVAVGIDPMASGCAGV